MMRSALLFYSVFAIVSPDFSCGGTNGYTCQPGLCCSQYGWCGSTSAYCATGCQPSFGTCAGISSTTVPTTTVPTVPASTVSPTASSSPTVTSFPISQDNSCGSAVRLRCAGTMCCSQYGWCGTTSAYCATGCQPLFGACNGIPPVSSSVPPPSSTSIPPVITSSSVPPVITTTTTSVPPVITTTTTSVSVSPTPTTPPGTCGSDLIIDDFLDPYRITFLGYNALIPPKSSSDDSTMTKLTILYGERKLRVTPKAGSYFYSSLGCGINLADYSGIHFNIQMPSTGSVSVGLEIYGANQPCDDSGTTTTVSFDLVKDLGIVSNGAAVDVKIPKEKFVNVNLNRIKTIIFSPFTKTGSEYIIGPIRFYCNGNPLSLPPLPVESPGSVIAPQSQPYTIGTGGNLLIEGFTTTSKTANSLGGFHGVSGLKAVYSIGFVTLTPTTFEDQFYTLLSTGSCADITSRANSYIHVSVKSLPVGQDFNVILNQHNPTCDDNKVFPETWEQIQASRYLQNGEMYIPMSHLPVTFTRVASIMLASFTNVSPIQISKIEIVTTVPAGYTVPGKAPQAPLIFKCTVPNTVAFGIDDGDPALTQQVLQIIKDENVKVTFFSLGLPLRDTSNNLVTNYRTAIADGNLMAFHSNTHPPFSELPGWMMDYQIDQSLQSISDNFNGLVPKYFRPPFGNVDARMRKKFADRGTKIIMWSINPEDTVWGGTTTPEKQLELFNKDLSEGGSIVVLHYLYPSTVTYFKQMIQSAKAAGKSIVTLDQCLGG